MKFPKFLKLRPWHKIGLIPIVAGIGLGALSTKAASPLSSYLVIAGIIAICVGVFILDPSGFLPF